MPSLRLALFVTCAATVLTAAVVLALENTTALEFTDAPCCAAPSDAQVCFYEQPDFRGRCACAGLEPAFEDIKLGNGGAYASVRVPAHRNLVLNVFTDDFDRNTESIETSCANKTLGIARRFAVGTRDSVCLYTQRNFHGEKLCLLPSARRHHCVDGFASVLFFPTTNPRVQADIKDDKRRSASARALGKETDLDRRRFDVTITRVAGSSDDTARQTNAAQKQSVK